MAEGNDHFHKEPTRRRSSDNHDRSNPEARSHESGSGRAHGSQSGQRASLAEQLIAAAQQQSGQQQGGAGSGARPQGTSHHQSLSEQLLDAAREQQGAQQGSHHGSGSSGQQFPFGQQASAGSGSGGARAGRSGLPLPLILLLVLVLAVGGFGGSCMFSGLDSGGSGGFAGSGSGGWNSVQGTHGTYSIDSSLGKGNEGDKWTVLMYVCGSNLESESTRNGGGMATSNLLELTQASLNKNVNYVIETGGARRWQNNVVSARYLERYIMQDGYMTQVQRQPSASMAAASTLADFVSWGAKQYPADHYMLIFWDHGGGSIAGVCNDDLYPKTAKGGSDSLTLPEIREALKASGVKFDLVGFDTCLMSTLETAETLAPYSRYMVASEETEPGTGWDYTAWPTWLAQHPGTTGADLGTVICQTYYNKCDSVGVARTATLATTDLSKVKAVSKAFQNASDDIAYATVDSSSLRKLYQGAGRSESYGETGGFFSSSMNMVDLADLMNKTRDVVGSDADTVVSAIDDAVVFETHGRNRSGASGLSVFYPLQVTSKSDFYTYMDISDNTPYLQFLGVMYGTYNKYDWTKYDNYVSLQGEPVNEKAVEIAYDQNVGDDGHVNLRITEGLDQVAQVRIEMFIMLDEISTLCQIGSDNDLNGSYETGEFTDNFQNDWLTIDGNFVSAALTEQGDGYNLYYIPVNLNGERTGLVMEYDYETNEYRVLYAWNGNDDSTGMANRVGRALQKGDEVQFLFPARNTETGEESYIALGTMNWYDNPTIAYEDLGDGTFGFRYVITDVLGNEKATDIVYTTYRYGLYVK